MKNNIIIVCSIWILLVGTSFMWNFLKAEEAQTLITFQAARSSFDQILATRAWNAMHNGVYVPVTRETQPNPYLEGPLRDIEVNDKLTLTKVNPSFMTRQIAEIAAKSDGIQFHITSLRPIRPENRPTAREEVALKAFERGTKEVGEIINIGPESKFFYMAPLIAKEDCLLCHANQGYKEGDIRGGISVTLPFVSKTPITALITGHVVVGLVGVFGIFVFGLKLNNAYESIKRQAVIDHLTGIPNRRNFSERIAAEFSRSRRDKYPLSVIMGDIDNFKAYNDTYGHNSGDECIKKVAQSIEKALKRPGDFCARYGGEEFVIILPNTAQESAVYIAEEIRANVEQLGVRHKLSLPVGVVSMSLGVATTDVNVSTSHEELLKQADKALYLAKEKGRNCVEVFTSIV